MACGDHFRFRSLFVVFQGKCAEAVPLYRQSLGIREKTLGPEHPDVAESLNNLAGVLRSQASVNPLFEILACSVRTFHAPIFMDHCRSLPFSLFFTGCGIFWVKASRRS